MKGIYHLIMAIYYVITETLFNGKTAEEVTGYIDPVTKMPNRKSYLRDMRRAGPVSVMFIDLDGFKEYNDMAGHAEGDNKLILVGRLLTAMTVAQAQAGVKKTRAYRYAGDEFVVITESMNPVDLAENILYALHSMLGLGASIGITKTNVFLQTMAAIRSLHSKTDAATAVTKAADEAMYHAKKVGKDLIAVKESAKEPPYVISGLHVFGWTKERLEGVPEQVH